MPTQPNINTSLGSEKESDSTMATKSFKDLPKQAAPATIEQLQAQLAAAQAAIKAQAGGAPAPALTPPPVADEPVVISTGAGAPVDVPAVSAPVSATQFQKAVLEAAAMPSAPTGNAMSNPAEFMALMTGANSPQDSMNALLAASETDSSGGKMLFPMLTQQPGTTGGAFQRVNTKNSEFNQIDLPEGKRPFLALQIAYRYLGTNWPQGYDAQSTVKANPLWNIAIPQAKGQEAANLMLAGKAFQFSKNRKAFDVSEGGPGVIRPAIEFLLFEPDIGLFVFRTNGHYNSAKDARDQLIACAVTDANGNQTLPPFVGEFHPETTKVPRVSKEPIVHHWPRIQKLANNDARVGTIASAYKLFLQSASPEVREAVNEWFNGLDAPVTSTAINAMNAAAALG